MALVLIFICIVGPEQNLTLHSLRPEQTINRKKITGKEILFIGFNNDLIDKTLNAKGKIVKEKGIHQT